jgi:hypothetical protein
METRGRLKIPGITRGAADTSVSRIPGDMKRIYVFVQTTQGYAKSIADNINTKKDGD